MALPEEKKKQQTAPERMSAWKSTVAKATGKPAASASTSFKAPTQTTYSFKGSKSDISSRYKAATQYATEQQKQEKRIAQYNAIDDSTVSGATAKILTMAQENREQAQQALDMLGQLQQDPTSKYYNPYSASTSGAAKELANLGVDMTGFDADPKKWISDNAGFMQYYNLSTASGGVLKSGGNEAAIGYWYNQLRGEQETTDKASAEWDALQTEMRYLATKPGANLSDDDILAAIDWKKYPTLAKMDSDKANGTPSQLTKSIGYSADAMKGVLWGIRNQDISTGDAFMDAVKGAAGQGKGFESNGEYAARSVYKENGQYNPYYSPNYYSTNMDKTAMNYGMDGNGFAREWFTDEKWGELRNQAIAGDTEAEKLLKAEEFTEACEDELAAVKEQIKGDIDRNGYESVMRSLSTDEGIKQYFGLGSGNGDPVFDYANYGGQKFEAKNLWKLHEGLGSSTGNMPDLTRGVPYSIGDLRQFAAEYGVTKGDAQASVDYANSIATTAGGAGRMNTGTVGVYKQKNEQVGLYAGALGNAGLDPTGEKYANATGAQTDDVIASIDTAVNSGVVWTADAKGAVGKLGFLLKQDNLAETVAPAVGDKLNEMAKEKAGNPADYAADVQGAVDGVKSNEPKQTTPEEYAASLQGTVDEMKGKAANAPKREPNTEPADLFSMKIPQEELYNIRMGNFTQANSYVAAHADDFFGAMAAIDKANREWEDYRYRQQNGFYNGLTTTGAIRGALESDYQTTYDALSAVAETDEEKAALHEFEKAFGYSQLTDDQIFEMLKAKNGYRFSEDRQPIVDDILASSGYNIDAVKDQLVEQARYDMVEKDDSGEVSDALKGLLEKAGDSIEWSFSGDMAKEQAAIEQSRADAAAAADVINGLSAHYMDGVLENSGEFGTNMLDFYRGAWEKYNSQERKEYTDSFYVDYYMSEGLLKPEDMPQFVEGRGKELDDAIVATTQDIEDLKASGAPAEIIANAETALGHLNAERELLGTYSIDSNEDYGSTLTAYNEGLTAWFGPAADAEELQYRELDYISSMMQAGDENYERFQFIDGELNLLFRLGSEQEQNRFRYILQKDGVQAAGDYLSMMSDMLSVRSYDDMQQRIAEATSENGFKGVLNRTVLTGASIASAPLRMFGSLYAQASTVGSGDFNPYSPAMIFNNFSSGVRGSTKQYIDENYTGFLKDVLNLAYDAVTTVGDSTANSIFGGLSAVAMGYGSVADAMTDARARGANAQQMLGMGMLTWLAETGTEFLPMQKMQEAFRLGSTGATKETLLKIIKDSFWSDTAGELVNDISEEAFDQLVMGYLSDENLSNRQNSIEKYVADGMSYEDAEAKVNREFLEQLGYTFILSTVTSTTGPLVTYGVGSVGRLKTNIAITRGQNRAISALYGAMNANGTGGSVTEAAAVASKWFGGNPNFNKMTGAFVQSLGENGGIAYAQVLQEHGVTGQKLFEIAAQYPGGQCASVAEGLMTRQGGAKGVSAEEITNAVKADMVNVERIQSAMNALDSFATSEAVRQKLGENPSPAVVAANEAADTAIASAEQAKTKAEEAQNKVAEAEAAVADANAQTVANPTPEAIKAESNALDALAQAQDKQTSEQAKADAAEKAAEEAVKKADAVAQKEVTAAIEEAEAEQKNADPEEKAKVEAELKAEAEVWADDSVPVEEKAAKVAEIVEQTEQPVAETAETGEQEQPVAEQTVEEAPVAETPTDVVSSYNSFVESGNEEEAGKIVEEVAKQSGFTMTGFHGTAKNFTEFRAGNAPGFGKGVYITDSEEGASNYGNVKRVAFKLDNPYTGQKIDASGTKAYERYLEAYYKREAENWGISLEEAREDYKDSAPSADEMLQDEDASYLNDALRELGFDGIAMKDSNDIVGMEYVIFDPKNVKLLDPVVKDFNGNVVPLEKRFDIQQPVAETATTETPVAETEAPVTQEAPVETTEVVQPVEETAEQPTTETPVEQPVEQPVEAPTQTTAKQKQQKQYTPKGIAVPIADVQDGIYSLGVRKLTKGVAKSAVSGINKIAETAKGPHPALRGAYLDNGHLIASDGFKAVRYLSGFEGLEGVRMREGYTGENLALGKVFDMAKAMSEGENAVVYKLDADTLSTAIKQAKANGYGKKGQTVNIAFGNAVYNAEYLLGMAKAIPEAAITIDGKNGGVSPAYVSNDNFQNNGALVADGVILPVIQKYAGTIAIDGITGKVSAPQEEVSYLKTPPTRPTAKGNIRSDGTVRTPLDIATRFTEQMGIGHYFNNVKQRNNVPAAVRGYFEQNHGLISTNAGDGGNTAVLFHEIGHYVARETGITGTQQMVDNLPSVFFANYTAAQLPGEAMAEFMVDYCRDRALAVAFAGNDFVNNFEKAIAKNDKLNKAVTEMVNETRKFLSADANEQIGATLKSRSEVGKEQRSLSDTLTHFFTRMVDSTATVQRLDKKAGTDGSIRRQVLFSNMNERRAHNILAGDALTDRHGTTIIGESLSQRLSKSGLKAKDVELFQRYLIGKHSIDRDAANKTLLSSDINRDSVKAFVQQMESEHPEFVSAAQAYQSFRHDFMQEYMVNAGYLSQEALDKMEQMYPNYVPGYREMDVGSNSSLPSRNNGNDFVLRGAKGSERNIIKPMESFFDMVKKIVKMNAYNDVALAFDDAYHSTKDLGEFAMELGQDYHYEKTDLSGVKEQIEKALTDEGVDPNAITEALGKIADEQVRRVNEGRVSGQNVMRVQHEDGTVTFYKFNDVDLFNALQGIDDPTSAKSFLGFLGRGTRFMTMLTTGSNALFGARNFLRDFQNSVNYGTWATTYMDGLAKWLGAAFDVITGKGSYQEYEAMGGGGFNRVDTASKAGNDDIMSAVFGNGVNRGLKGFAKNATSKVWSVVTLEKLNEVIEQTSRYAEYKYGKNDKTTAEGRMEAFEAAQDVTVDFTRHGSSAATTELRKLIPFFNASMQGTYRLLRNITNEQDRQGAVRRLSKSVLNTALTSALAATLIFKLSDPEDKKALEHESDDIWAGHILLPNFLRGNGLGEQPFIRIPLSQDPVSYAVHSFVTNYMFGKAEVKSGWVGEDMAIDAAATASTIIGNLFGFANSTILSPYLQARENRTYYGSSIVPYRLQQGSPENQYTEDTYDVCKWLGARFGVSPMKLQYVIEQYSGWLGQLAMPFASNISNGGWDKALTQLKTTAQRKFTTDPLVSNSVVSAFYDQKTLIEQTVLAGKNGQPLVELSRNLSPQEAQEAYDEAVVLKSLMTKSASTISSYYDEIDRINEDANLTDEQKYEMTSNVRREMIQYVQDFNELYLADFVTKYEIGDGFMDRMVKHMKNGVVLQ